MTNYDSFDHETAEQLRQRDAIIAEQKAIIAAYNNGKGEFLKQSAVCCICLEGFVEMDNNAMTRCKHLYHNRCLTKWARYHKNCAYCRNQIDTWWVYPSSIPCYIRLFYGKLW